MTESVRLQTFRELNKKYRDRLLNISGIIIVAIAEQRILTAEEQQKIYELSSNWK